MPPADTAAGSAGGKPRPIGGEAGPAGGEPRPIGSEAGPAGWDGSLSLAGWFRACYGRDPDALWRAPGRVNLIGEHTDYNDGFVLPFAIDRSVLVAGSARTDGMLEVRSRQADSWAAVQLDGLEPGVVRGWAAYPAGVAWVLRAAGLPVGGANLAIDSDLPQGAGLSSSAALECAVVGCLADLAGARLARGEMAALARRAENDFVGVPCGIMDQSAAMLCLAGHALLLDCRTGSPAQVPLDPAGAGLRLLLIDTGVRHDLAASEYAERRRDCEAAARRLGVPALRDADVAAAASLADPVLARRAGHVVTENARVGEAVGLLRAGRLAACGPLLTASHRSLRDEFEVSWPEADVAVDAALEAGALGARMIGGGFGGCVLALAAGLDAVAAAVCSAYEHRGWPVPAITAVVPSAGAGRIAATSVGGR